MFIDIIPREKAQEQKEQEVQREQKQKFIITTLVPTPGHC
jgi:hypothetical protein